jgi:hypothetical protein
VRVIVAGCVLLLLAVAAALLAISSGSAAAGGGSVRGKRARVEHASVVATQTGIVPTPIGVGPRDHPGALLNGVVTAAPVAEMRCERGSGRRFEVHLELFAMRRVVLVPAGVGIAPPYRRADGEIIGGRCSYPALTRDPTGVVQILAGREMTLGALFSLWGESLSKHRLLSYSGRVAAFVDGRETAANPRAIELRPHTEIVLELGGYVPPHTTYSFPAGL